MKYCELKKVIEKQDGYICFFGAGMLGSTWAYDLIKAMGGTIDFYCDNNKKEGTAVKDGIKIVSLETLYSLKENVLVFITVPSRYQSSIKIQLERNGIHNIVQMDYLFMQTFIESLIEMNDPIINERFKCILDDEEYISRQFEYCHGCRPNLDNPRSFNEKLQWLKLHDRNPEYTQMVDKYEVKKFVADKIGEKYIIPTLGIYDSFDDINFDKLPNQFVLKCTHDSGSVVICKNKDEFDRIAVKNFLDNQLRFNYFWAGREWPYKNVRPRIIAEPYMVDESNVELKDYKIFNFDGKAKLIQVDYDRFVYHKRNLYTTNWEYVDAMIQYPTDPGRCIKRPKKLEDMIAISETLSKGIPHVRIDFYCIEEEIYFGELTFYHGGGGERFVPKELGYRMGDWIKYENVR